MVGGREMSVDLFRRAAARDSEFKGQNADLDKYENPKSWKVTAAAWIVVLGVFAAGYFFFL
jgi:hypothetical protein